MGPGCEREDVSEQIEVSIKYAGYIERQAEEVLRQERYEQLQIPQAFDYTEIMGLSNEILEKLLKVQPATLGQAGRIPGVTAAAISLLLVHLKKKGYWGAKRSDD
jgi:tRNA uridine 5-carboxymethylaminomethyl modification enzyme